MFGFLKDRRVGIVAALISAVAIIIASIIGAIPWGKGCNRKGKIELITFTLNEDSCIYHIDSFGYIRTKEGLEEFEIGDSLNFGYNPLFDITFNNKGDANTILKKIVLNINDFDEWQGDGEENLSSEAIETLHRFKLEIPHSIIDKFYDGNGEKLKHGNFKIEKVLLPPINIAPGTPARIQLEIKTNYTMMSTYDMEIEYVFSNGQTLRSNFLIDF